MIVPIGILATGAFLAAVFAILSVLPKVTQIEGPVGADANILFFGIFTSLSEQEWSDRIVASLDDDETLYRVMLRDIYQNGQVLQHKKYKYLLRLPHFPGRPDAELYRLHRGSCLRPADLII